MAYFVGAIETISTQSLYLPGGPTSARPVLPQNGMLRYNSTIGGIEAYVGGSWLTVAGVPGTLNNPATNIAQLQASGITASGAYYFNIPTVGTKQIYADLSEPGGWYLLMRGYSYDSYAYGNAVYTDANSYSESDLLTPNFGNFAKNNAFYYMTGCNQIKVVAGGFSGPGCDGNYRTFTFNFGGTNTPNNLMFTTANAMSWTGTGFNTYGNWRATFGQDRTFNPSFQRYGSSSNQSVGEVRGLYGCGQPLMFGFNAHDSPNDVNSGIGTNVNYCGGNPGGFARGSWMANGGYVQIWAKGY